MGKQGDSGLPGKWLLNYCACNAMYERVIHSTTLKYVALLCSIHGDS